ncbi:conserved hypothetical protein, partial [Ricinus communis]
DHARIMLNPVAYNELRELIQPLIPAPKAFNLSSLTSRYRIELTNIVFILATLDRMTVPYIPLRAEAEYMREVRHHFSAPFQPVIEPYR